MYGLCAATSHLDRRQVPAREVAGFGSACRQGIGETGCAGEAASVAVNCLKPAVWAFEEACCWDKHDGNRPIDWGEHESDEAHIVVQREPADTDIVVRNSDSLDHYRVAVGDQRMMGDDDTFGCCGRPRSELEKSDVIWCYCWPVWRR